MWLVDDTRTPSDDDQTLISFAVDLGADPVDAEEMVGAVLTYCRRQHGSTNLSRGYLQFLTARAVASTSGLVAVRESMLRGLSTGNEVERMMVLALESSADSPALYEAYRHALLFAITTGLTASGYALQLDLRRMTVTPATDQLLVWGRVIQKMAGWIADWRQGNPGLSVLMVSGYCQFLTAPEELRDCLLEHIHREVVRRSISPLEIRWIPG